MALDPKDIEDVSDVFMIDQVQQAWLRTFPLLTSFGHDSPVDGAMVSTDAIPKLDNEFWQAQTEAIEKIALTKCSDLNIDGIFYEVTWIIDENLSRFDPMVNYFGRHYPDGDPVRQAGRVIRRDDQAACRRHPLDAFDGQVKSELAREAIK